MQNDETPGKYIHTKKKNRKTLFFLSGALRIAFLLKKIETEIHHRDG
jgi:hypothetical protein